MVKLTLAEKISMPIGVVAVFLLIYLFLNIQGVLPVAFLDLRKRFLVPTCFRD